MRFRGRPRASREPCSANLRTGRRELHTYTFDSPFFANTASKAVLLFVTLFPIFVVVALRIAGNTHSEYLVLFAYPIIGYWWYRILKPVKSVQVLDKGDLVIVTGFGTKTVPADSIRTIRPLSYLSPGDDFVLQHEKGAELLFGNPTAVSLIAAALRQANPAVHLHHVPHPPG